MRLDVRGNVILGSEDARSLILFHLFQLIEVGRCNALRAQVLFSCLSFRPHRPYQNHSIHCICFWI
jgi:hypothetical protein